MRNEYTFFNDNFNSNSYMQPKFLRTILVILSTIVSGMTLFVYWSMPVTNCPIAAQSESEGWFCPTSLPTGRSELAATVLDGQIYVAGGLHRWGATSAFERYDPATGSWDTLAPLPQDLHHLAVAATEEYVYLTVGFQNTLQWQASAETWRYTRARNEWERLADMPSARAAHGMAVVDGLLYVVGGVGDEPVALWIYDPATNQWRNGESLPHAREHLAVVTLNEEIYVIGGRWLGRDRAEVDIYTPRTNRWRQGAALPEARGGFTASTVGDRIHATGGEHLEQDITYDTHFIYDASTDQWSIASVMPTARHGLTSVGIGEAWYVIGGAHQANTRTTLSISARVDIYRH